MSAANSSGTIFLLIRHGTTDALVESRLVSRLPGVPLNAQGREEVAQIAKALAGTLIDAIYSGPLERSRETAEIISRTCCRTYSVIEELNEIDLGEWSGNTVAKMHGDEEWNTYHRLRSCLRPPGGESLLDVQARLVPVVTDLRRKYDGKRVALITHADVIKAGLAHYGGIPLDLITRYEIAPASVSTIVVGEDFVKIGAVNVTFSKLRTVIDD